MTFPNRNLHFGQITGVFRQLYSVLLFRKKNGIFSSLIFFPKHEKSRTEAQNFLNYCSAEKEISSINRKIAACYLFFLCFNGMPAFINFLSNFLECFKLYLLVISFIIEMYTSTSVVLTYDHFFRHCEISLLVIFFY